MKKLIISVLILLIASNLFALSNLSLKIDVQKNKASELLDKNNNYLNLGLSYDYDNVNISLTQSFDINDSFKKDCINFKYK